MTVVVTVNAGGSEIPAVDVGIGEVRSPLGLDKDWSSLLRGTLAQQILQSLPLVKVRHLVELLRHVSVGLTSHIHNDKQVVLNQILLGVQLDPIRE